MITVKEYLDAVKKENEDIVKEYNKELIKEYPFLLPKNIWTGKLDSDYDYEFTWMDDMPDGWRIAFGDNMLKELKEELIKHKYEKDEFDESGTTPIELEIQNNGFEDTWLNHYFLMQIKEKFGCYDESTEVLTKDGWKLFRNVTLKDEFATLDSDGETLIYQNPTDIINESFNENMYHLSFRGVDLLVTPNHNLYVAKGSYFYHKKNNEKRIYPFEFVTPDVYFGKDKRFKKCATWVGEIPDDEFIIKGRKVKRPCSKSDTTKLRTYSWDDKKMNIHSWLKFLGYYIADGCVGIGSNENSDSYNITLAFNHTGKSHKTSDFVKNLIHGIDCVEYKCKKENGTHSFTDKIIGKWLYTECYNSENEKRAWTKKVPDFIKNLPPSYIEEFLTYLYLGDGHKSKTANILYTTSKQLSDDVCELLIKAGYTFSVSERFPKHKNNKYNIYGNHICYEINWLSDKDAEIDMSKMKHSKSFVEQYEHYKGRVYCVTVPNHILYVRRNGKGVWCGNSLRWYSGSAPQEVHDIVYKYEKLSEKICIKCGEPAKYISTGWICPWCDKCAHDNFEKYKKLYKCNTAKFENEYTTVEEWYKD